MTEPSNAVLATIRELADAAKVEIERILGAPCVDPDAPAGYVTRGYLEADTRRRYAAVREICDRLIGTIEQGYGPVAGGVAREHLATALALVQGTELH